MDKKVRHEKDPIRLMNKRKQKCKRNDSTDGQNSKTQERNNPTDDKKWQGMKKN